MHPFDRPSGTPPRPPLSPLPSAEPEAFATDREPTFAPRRGIRFDPAHPRSRDGHSPLFPIAGR